MNKHQKEQFIAQVTKAYKMTASNDPAISIKGARFLAKALEIPLRQGVFAGDIITSLFVAETVENASLVEYPLDPIAPGQEKELVAYTIPGEGDMPTKHFEGTYVAVPTYEYGHAISWLRKLARDARWGILSRYLEAMEAGVVKKRNDDGWRTLIAASVDRNIIVQDTQAAAGVFTKRLVSNMKTVFVRNGGGNVASTGRRKLTDIYLSVEGNEEMRNWGLDQIDEVTRREIYLADDGSERLSRVFGVNIHPMTEFGENQEYQNYFTNDLGAAFTGSDVELVIGVDKGNRNSFVHPESEVFSVQPDTMQANWRRQGIRGMGAFGFGVLDARDVIIASY